MSTNNFNFIVDAYEYTRTERAALIKDWKIGVENLRVCWSGEDKSKNCGHCEKCVRTKLNFMAVGIDNLPSMPNNLTVEELTNPNLISRKYHNASYCQIFEYYREILYYAISHNTLSQHWRNLLENQLVVWENKFSNKFLNLIFRWRR